MATKSNKNLIEARKNRNDEFYPQTDVIAPVVTKYAEQFAGKNIYLNTDDYTMSKMWELCFSHFKEWNLKSLTATGYKKRSHGVYARTVDGEHIQTKKLFSDGSYASAECHRILHNSDIVVTCPPYSLNQQFINDMIASNKKFLLLVGIASFTYNSVIEHLMNHSFFIESMNCGAMEFLVPDDYDGDCVIKEDGKKYTKVLSSWISNITEVEETEAKPMNFDDTSSEPKTFVDGIPGLLYPSCVKKIPNDYIGAVRLPITVVKNMNRGNIIETDNGKFILLGTTDTVYGEHRLYVNGKKKFPGLIFFKTV